MGLLELLTIGVAGLSIGLAIGFYREARLERLHAEYVSQLLARKESWGIAKSVARKDSEKTEDAGVTDEGDKEPWRDDPEFAWCDVTLDPSEGVVHIVTDEDAYEEDIHLFLSRYGVSVRDL